MEGGGGGGKLNDRGFKDTSCSRVYSEEVVPQRFCEMPNEKTFLGCVGRSCAQIYHRLGVQETGSRWHPAAHFLCQIDHCRPNSAGSAENSLHCKKSSFFQKKESVWYYAKRIFLPCHLQQQVDLEVWMTILPKRTSHLRTDRIFVFTQPTTCGSPTFYPWCRSLEIILYPRIQRNQPPFVIHTNRCSDSKKGL